MKLFTLILVLFYVLGVNVLLLKGSRLQEWVLWFLILLPLIPLILLFR